MSIPSIYTVFTIFSIMTINTIFTLYTRWSSQTLLPLYTTITFWPLYFLNTVDFCFHFFFENTHILLQCFNSILCINSVRAD